MIIFFLGKKCIFRITPPKVPTPIPPRIINDIQFFQWHSIFRSSKGFECPYFRLFLVYPSPPFICKSAYMQCHARDRPNPGFNPQIRNIVLQIIVCAMSHETVVPRSFRKIERTKRCQYSNDDFPNTLVILSPIPKDFTKKYFPLEIWFESEIVKSAAEIWDNAVKWPARSNLDLQKYLYFFVDMNFFWSKNLFIDWKKYEAWARSSQDRNKYMSAFWWLK